MNKSTLKVAVIQYSPALQGLAGAISRIEQAAAENVQLVVLPELHNSAYFCQSEEVRHFDLAEPLHGPTLKTLSALARKHQLVIVGSIFERRAAGIYHNTAIVLDNDGSLAGFYRKSHIPDDPGFYEKFYFTPGDNGIQPIDTAIGRLGVLLCWDQWFPEAARLMALQGAEILIYPTAIGWDKSDSAAEQARQRQAWILVQRGHAVANGLPLIACNRFGLESHDSDSATTIHFWGNSFVCGPQGEWLAQAGSDQDEPLYAHIDKQRSETIRRIWPFFRDRRTDLYAPLTKTFID
ncbi:MAG: carbon-nitrogen hydrolase [gamma proteobacterium symbiont of Bathyaustriella thionipta]|nr:carbon-nitrogen hydrolase [gamma proteobacterium symbiont of Bathyaustriella thionipta]